MSSKFHIAMFCSVQAYSERKLFYTEMFGAEPSEGLINDGAVGREYQGSVWNQSNGCHFALLKNPDLKDVDEKIAHMGLIFNDSDEFNTEIQKRGIGTEGVKSYPEGHKQVFIEGRGTFEWEFLYIHIDEKNKR